MRIKAWAAVALLVSSAAQAGPYSDDLAKCLVSSTSKEERIALVRWMFAAASAHPAVASISKVSSKIMDEANASTGALFMRRLTDSCKDKAKTAMQYEGPATIQTSFTVLGQVAASEMFSSPEVKQAMAGLEQHVDGKKIQELLGK